MARPDDRSRDPLGDASARRRLEVGKYAGIGIQFALTFMIFGAAGYWLDQKLGTRPWLLILGIFLGATGAFISLVRRVPPSTKQTWAERHPEE